MKILLIIIQIAIYTSCFSQQEIRIQHYKTSKDFNLKKESQTEVLAVTKEINLDFIIVDQFINTQSGDKEKKLVDCWAFKHKDEFYFNLKYLGNSKLEGKFLKLDYIGEKFCYAYLEDSTLEKFNDKKIFNWVGSLATSAAGLALGSIDKVLTSKHSNWETKGGNFKKILFINLTKENYDKKGVYNSLKAIYINKKQIAGMSRKKHKKTEWKNFKFEFALNTIVEKDKELN